MDEEIVDMIESPEPCEQKTEYDNRIEDHFEIEPVEEESEEPDSSMREEIEHEFARYERNYRARRIRELTRRPLKKARRGSRPDAMAA